jgi:hypothetical protein
MSLRVLVALLLPSWLLSACHSCSADTPPLASTSRELPALATPEHEEPKLQDPAAHGIPLTATEFGPFDGRIFLTAGSPDFENRHTSTVMISTLGPLAAAQCSGILLSPLLVLTAASCVCLPREVRSPEGGTSTLFDSSACSPSAYATAIVYGEVVNEYTAAMGMHSYTGTVRPHPDFKLVLDEEQAVLTQRADLAVLVLETPVPGRIRPAALSNREVRAQETLLMAGYGYGKEFGQIFGLRFVRRDKALGEVPPGAGRFLYEQQGTFLYNGFKGGPCFQENGGAPALTGIASLGTARELSFTSIYAHRSWLDSELQQASKHAPAQKERP